jgi:hypothetical protein
MGGTCSIYKQIIKEYKILNIKLEGKISLEEI